MSKSPALRWRLAVMLLLASTVNYLDRQTLSLLAPTIQRSLRISDLSYAGVVNAFLVAYSFAYLVSGRLTDRLGTRASMALFMGWWSLADALTGLARSATSLGACRFLLGLGEAGNYTVAPRVAAEWFPPEERGIVIGLTNLGITAGATLAPVIVVGIASRYSWQAAFVVTGSLGILWLIPWLLFYRPHSNSSGGDRCSGAGTAPQTCTAPEPPPLNSQDSGRIRPSPGTVPSIRPVPDSSPTHDGAWRALLRRRDVWALMAARLLTDPIWYFYQFWFSKYLSANRGVGQTQLGILWIVFVAADVGALLGGCLSGPLIRRGRTPIAARMTILGICACVLALSPIVAVAPTIALCLGGATVMVLVQMVWMVNLATLVVDRMPRPIVGTAFGLIAAASPLGGIVMNSFVGWLVMHHSYLSWFVMMSALAPVAYLILTTAQRTDSGSNFGNGSAF